MRALLRRPFALASLAFVSLAGAQEQTGGPPVVSAADIVLEQYVVQNVDVGELYKLASSLVGRTYMVTERGAMGASMMRLGDTIVLYDTQEQVQRARALLARLDAAREDAGPSMESLEYRPRFVSLETAKQAISELVDLSLVPERALVILHGRRGDIDAALALLKRIDVPEKQVLLTCQLIEVGSAPQGPPLPKELVDNLQKLLPESHFTQTGMAMLKTSVVGQTAISVQIDTAPQSYRMFFTPVAFEESSASLTIADCSLVEDPGGGEERELFRTNTVLRGGEYTVLAATGATPRLLVVRVTPQ